MMYSIGTTNNKAILTSMLTNLTEEEKLVFQVSLDEWEALNTI
ncbi:hypothetical protein [Nostoc sp.]